MTGAAVGAVGMALAREAKALILLAGLFNHTARHERLKLLVSAQAQHFLSPAGGVAGTQVAMNQVKEFLELVRIFPGENRDEFLGDKVRQAAGEGVFS